MFQAPTPANAKRPMKPETPPKDMQEHCRMLTEFRRRYYQSAEACLELRKQSRERNRKEN